MHFISKLQIITDLLVSEHPVKAQWVWEEYLTLNCCTYYDRQLAEVKNPVCFSRSTGL